MVQVLLIKKKNKYQKVKISGHANFKKAGKDIVCAAISGITFGTLNALDELFKNDISINIGDNDININVNNWNNDINIVLKTMKLQLLTVKQQYKNYLEIIEMEE